eukprot:5318742-Karenia_brevis.AAC.1
MCIRDRESVPAWRLSARGGGVWASISHRCRGKTSGAFCSNATAPSAPSSSLSYHHHHHWAGSSSSSSPSSSLSSSS